ncbi:outer dynein arm-docking complex subunit 4-like [Schistocerca americana]|uniref:outer dynein arm-docking complex subunit 4-like n=1 Tax=Schistocerca americana TaxID=7009 RepID=UPI001F4F47FA|nr:outer dynein arm-docking complex subunit 4-like [Schistocerca americana]
MGEPATAVSQLLGATREAQLLQSFLGVSLAADTNEAAVGVDKKRAVSFKRAAAAASTEDQVEEEEAEEEVERPRARRPARRRPGAVLRRPPPPPPQQQEQASSRKVLSPFAQILREIKLRTLHQQQSRPRQRRTRAAPYEELYTDKDRAAAVSIGSDDIKASLKEKKSKERAGDAGGAAAGGVSADPGTLLALASREMRAGSPRVALRFVHKALELRPEDKGALVARSKCYLLLGQPQLALQDAEAALRSEIVRCSAIFQKAEALYQLGDFEHSLMYHHRGLRLRPELDGFRLGVQKAQQAIQNTIGGKTLLLTPEPAESPAALAQTPPDDSKQETAATSVPSSGSAAGRRSASASAAAQHGHAPSSRPASGSACAADPAARRLLGALCVDKQYLEQLLQNPDIKCLRQEAASHILTEAEEGIEFLKTREEFWRQQRPIQVNNKKKKKH